MASNAAVLNKAADQLSLTIDTLAPVNENWLAGAIILTPIIVRPELLKAIGYDQGNTKFYRDLALSVGLKEAKLQVIANHFKNLLDFKEAYRNIDIKNAPVSRLQTIHKQAIAIAGNKSKLKFEHVKKAVENAVDNGEIGTSKIDYIADIDEQINFANTIDANALSKGKPPVKADSKTTQPVAKKAEPKKPVAKKPAAKKAEPKKPVAKKAEPKKPEVKKVSTEQEAEKEVTQMKTDTAVQEVSPKTTPKEGKTAATSSAPALEESKIDTTESTLVKTEQEYQSDATGTVHDVLIESYKNLSPDDRELILEIAMAFHGDQGIALLKACNPTQANILLKSIRRIA